MRSMENAIWSDKYAPKKLGEVLDNRKQIVIFHKWLSEFESGKSQGILMMGGPSGCGKTTIIRITTDLLSYLRISIDGDDLSNGRQKLEQALETITNRTMGKREKACIVIENVEDSNQSALSKILERSKMPIIGTCNSKYDPKLKALKTSSKCLYVELCKPREDHIVKFLQKTCKKEKVDASPSGLKELAAVNDCDVRRCLNELEFTRSNLKRESACIEIGMKRDVTPFEAAKALFKMSEMTVSELIGYAQADLAGMFVHENYLSNAVDITHACEAAADLSDGDRMCRNVPSEVGLCVDTILPARTCQTVHPSVRNFPTLLGKFSTQRKNERVCQDIEKRIQKGRKSDEGASVVCEILPQLRQMVLKNLNKTSKEKDRVKRDVAEVIERMRSLNMGREDMMGMFELEPVGHSGKSSYALLPSATKAALTRAWK